MFKGLGTMEPFSFTFNNGVVTGPNYTFDLRVPLAADSAAGRDFYRQSPDMLIHFVYEDWNKKFNSACIKAGGNLFLGVTWDTTCLIAAGTANLLSAAGAGILSAVEAWGRAYLGPATATPPPTNGGTQPPITTQCATVGKSPIAGQACCTGLVKDPFNVCNIAGDVPVETCVGTWACSIPDLWIYGGLGILALMMMGKR